MKRRKLLSYFFVVMMSIPFTSCHGSKIDENNVKEVKDFIVPEEFDNTREYEISFWSKNDTNIIQKTIYQDTIKKFNEIYPNIKVKMISKTNYEDIYADVIKNISTKTTPNVCITYPDHVATYLSGQDVVVPLDALMKNAKYGLGGSDIAFTSCGENGIYEKFLNECKYHGKYYSLPYMRSTEALYINQDKLLELTNEPVPEILTWDYIFDVCDKAIKAKENETDVLYPFIYKSVDNQMITMLKQKGYEYTTENAEVKLLNENTKSILNDLANKAQNKLFNIFAIISYPGNFLNAGQNIFAVDSTAGATWMGTNAPNIEIPEDQIVDFETIVRPIPQYDIDNPIMISQGPSMCLFDKEDKQEVLASWIFMQYLLSNEVQIPYSETEGYIPVTKTAIESADYQAYLDNAGATNYDNWDSSYISASYLFNKTDRRYSPASFFYKTKIDAAKLTIANIDNTFVTPVFNGSASVRSAAGKLIEKTMRQVIEIKKPVTDEYLDDLFKSMTTMYKLDEIVVTDNSSYNVRKKARLGKISSTAITLLIVLLVAWVGIGTYYLLELKKKKKNKN